MKEHNCNNHCDHTEMRATELAFKAVAVIIFLIPTTIYLCCGLWQLGKIMPDVLLHGEEATITDMFRITYLSIMWIWLGQCFYGSKK